MYLLISLAMNINAPDEKFQHPNKIYTRAENLFALLHVGHYFPMLSPDIRIIIVQVKLFHSFELCDAFVAHFTHISANLLFYMYTLQLSPWIY